VYERETEPVLDYYGEKLITNVNSDQPPFQVLRDILNEVTAWKE
jgi:adenylate kinase family enzyme